MPITRAICAAAILTRSQQRRARPGAVDDGRLDAMLAGACVENQIDVVGEFVGDVLRQRRADAAEAVGRGAATPSPPRAAKRSSSARAPPGAPARAGRRYPDPR